MRAIVFALNGLPAGWLGAYGNDWVGTPHLDRLAAEAVTFDRHISDAPSWEAARRAWLRMKNPSPTPPLKREGLPEGAGGSGSPLTVLVRANHPDTDGPDWFYAGWGEVFDARPQAEDGSPLEELIRALPAVLDRLADVTSFLLWIETDRLVPPWDVQQDVFAAYMEEEVEDEPPAEAAEAAEPADDGDDGEHEADEPAEPGEPDEAEPEPEPVVIEPLANPEPGPFDRADLDAWDWLHKTFAAVVTKFDAELGAAFDLLRARGLDASAAWLVTSDHGFPLGEHGQLGVHRPWLHEELVHLPLLLRLPNAEQAGRRVPGFTQPPDLSPTLCALLGLPAAAGAPGFDLLPLARGEAESRRAFAATYLEQGGAAEMALRTDDWALLVPLAAAEGDPPREPRLYEKPDDRWEVNDLRPRNVERADELEAQLRAALGLG